MEWTGKEGLDVETHSSYIKDFCDHFYKSILRLVDDAVKKNDELMNDRIYADILQVMSNKTTPDIKNMQRHAITQ